MRLPCLLLLIDKTTYGNDINRLVPFSTQKGQDVGACLEFLRVPITTKQIKDELIVNGIKDLDHLNEYAKVVLRTRNELKTWINAIGNDVVKTKAGI